MGTLAYSLAREKGKSVFSFITRDSDSAVYNYTTGAFVKNLHLHLVTNNNDRANYRVPYREVYSGMFTLELDVSTFVDDSYTLTSRVLDNDSIESLQIDSVTISVLSGEPQDGTLSLDITLSPGLNIFSYIRDTFTGMYLRSDMSGFKVFSPLDDEESVRVLFRHSFIPNSSTYTLSKSLATVPDTVLDVSVYKLSSNIEYLVGRPIKIHVLNGKQQRGVLFKEVLLSHDTLANDTYRYVSPNGEPIGSADVYVFKKSEYSSDRLDLALGKTTTDPQGRWVAPIPVPAGDTYTILFFKSSEFGPDTADVVV